ncbi:AAA family ATPase [Rhodobacterales bacterium HKCCE3408]|nr:AAA family ATPase [Rhodobacterales bacterium HKCCE3408]
MAVRRILLTGCSGAGKSALLAEMAARGWDTVKEPGRRVTRAEERMGGTGLPWIDPERFARLCLKMAMADWEGARAGTVIFDRGVLDAALALARADAEPGAAAGRCTYDLAVLAPPWESIFDRDPERQHSFDDAVAEYEDIAAALADLGMEVETLPEAPVAARADWLEAILRAR